MLKNIVRLAAAGALVIGHNAAAVAGSGADKGKYRVALTPMVILPPEQAHAPGEERVAKAGDVLLKAPLGWKDTATLAQPLALTISGVSDEFPADTLLSAAKASGGDLAGLPAGAKTYCGPERADLAKSLAAAVTLGLTSLGSRIAKFTRFCLVDSDVDGRFDKSFLVGLKRAEDRKMIDIEPVAYEAVENRPIPASHISLTYHDGALLIGPNFQVGVSLLGGPQLIDAIYTGNLGDKRVRTKWQYAVKSRKIPQPIKIGPAQFTVTAFDAETKTAKIRYDQDLSLTPIELQYRPQTIYVYVP